MIMDGHGRRITIATPSSIVFWRNKRELTMPICKNLMNHQVTVSLNTSGLFIVNVAGLRPMFLDLALLMWKVPPRWKSWSMPDGVRAEVQWICLRPTSNGCSKIELCWIYFLCKSPSRGGGGLRGQVGGGEGNKLPSFWDMLGTHDDKGLAA